MEFKLINLLPENWLHALGATLFHSLWLGVILALFAGLVMFTTRKASATLRYNLLTLCLGLFVIAIGSAFYIELQAPVYPAQSQVVHQTGINLPEAITNQPGVTNVQQDMYSGISKILSLWNAYAYQIVLVWFLIICGKSIQLMVGLNGVYHLRRHKTYAAGKKWDEKLNQLAAKLGLTQEVKLVQSGIAQVPMVVGHFKPLILIPIGLINGLSNAEVEAILSHELAHIKRKDYLVNVLQSFIEIVFFFNPAVLWVSQLIKTEREHCCDDLAIACVNDRKNYVQALIVCQEFKQRAPAYAMAVTGRKGSLLHRASRMLFNTNSTLNKMEKTILTIALVSVVVCTAAFKSVGSAKTVTKKEIASTIVALQDTTRKKKTVEKKSGDQLEKEINEKMDRQLKQLDEKKKTSENAADVKARIADQKAREADMQAVKQDAKAREEDAKARIENERLRREDEKFAKEDAKLAAENAKWAKEDAKWAKEDEKWAKEDEKWAKEDEKWAQENKDSKNVRAPRPPRPPRPARAPRAPRAAVAVPAVPASPATPPPPPTPPTPPAYSGTTSTKTGSERRVTTKTVTNGDGHDYTDEINQQLMSDHIISSTNKLSYKLNKDELVVNGVKQSTDVQQKYKKRFLKNDGHSLMYNFQIENNKN
ncbi:M56 family metallopeptidase [Pedobacter sp. UBA5917]|jgi:beta-lactamase regulating signal transducer with metallopeptidase domain|uniref:M56 family metallopeptidase n=1 Tax=Pedobacter sp. UBA5917 TaxID=1947061 RepID=UPI0025DB4876|nr:M56 family metallopeptidase [Pedobacter sp. UBA5917]